MTLFDYYKGISKILGDQVETVVKTPFFWVLVFLLLGCLVLTYNGTSQNRLSGSLINTVRLFGTFLIDTFNSIVLACKSLFGFLDVLRLLLFGHLGHGTIYVLTNYAIIFLSMASFATTLQGLFSLIGWVGILVSFGIQVMELVAVTGIIICVIPPKSKPKETVTYIYQPSDLRNAETSGSPGPLQIPDNEEKSKRKWGRLRLALLILALSFAYIASVIFSYCYIFNAIVMPGIAYDDYVESINLVNQQTESYENDLTLYRTELVKGLTRFLNDVSEQSQLSESNIAAVDTQIQSCESEVASLQNQLVSITNSLAGVQPGSELAASLEERGRNITDNLTAAEERLSQLIADRDSPEYALYQAVQLLTQYLADPLYLHASSDESEGTASKEQELNRAFDIVMLQGYAPHSEEIEVSPEQIRTAFSNYTMLCRYYAAHNGSGLNLSGTGDNVDSVDTLLSQRAGTMEQYNSLQDTGYKAPDEHAENTAEDEKPSRNAADYLNEETGKLLIAAMHAIEEVPRFSIVGELWSGGTLTGTGGIYPKEPEAASYLRTLNDKYRASNGQLSLQERAFSKLFSENSKIAWFGLFVALGLDLMIICLCFLRGREYYANSARNSRQMISLLFVVSSTEEEHQQNSEGRLVVLAGAVLGILTYLLYFKIHSGAANSSAITAFVLIVGGILLVSFLQSLREVLRVKPKNPNEGNGPGIGPIQERFSEDAYQLFNENLKEARFQKRCTIRRPQIDAMDNGEAYYKREKNIWRKIEEHKIRLFTLAKDDYDIIVTNESTEVEYYVLEKDVEKHSLKFQFTVLHSFGLVHSVLIPADQANPQPQEGEDAPAEAGTPTETGAPTEPEGPERSEVPAYLLTREFIRLLYECILLRTVMGGNFEYTLEDDMLDYEQEDDDED